MFVQDIMLLSQKDSQAPSYKDPQALWKIALSQIAPQVSQAPKPSPNNSWILYPSLQHELSELCLFHDARIFCDRIELCES